MSPERQAYFRGKLLGLQADIEDDLNASKSASNVVELDTAIGRLSRMDAAGSAAAPGAAAPTGAATSAHNHALKRVKNGTYGQCVRCRKPIPEERLELAPDVFLCAVCIKSGKRYAYRFGDCLALKSGRRIRHRRRVPVRCGGVDCISRCGRCG